MDKAHKQAKKMWTCFKVTLKHKGRETILLSLQNVESDLNARLTSATKGRDVGLGGVASRTPAGRGCLRFTTMEGVKLQEVRQSWPASKLFLCCNHSRSLLIILIVIFSLGYYVSDASRVPPHSQEPDLTTGKCTEQEYTGLEGKRVGCMSRDLGIFASPIGNFWYCRSSFKKGIFLCTCNNLTGISLAWEGLGL